MKLIAALVSTTLAATAVFDGKCPKNPAFSNNFNLESYMGRWYNIANLPTNFQFEGNTCGTADYTLRPDNVVTVKNSEKMNWGFLAWLNIRQSATGTASPDLQNGEVKGLDVRFYSRDEDLSFKESNYNVLDTDNQDFSYVWSCTEMPANECKWWHRFFGGCGPERHELYLWIITRDAQKGINDYQEHMDKIEQLWDAEYDFNRVRDAMIPMAHNDCRDYKSGF